MDTQVDSALSKVVLIGESGTGKSCAVLRYVRDFFDEKTSITIGANFLVKDM